MSRLLLALILLALSFPAHAASFSARMPVGVRAVIKEQEQKRQEIVEDIEKKREDNEKKREQIITTAEQQEDIRLQQEEAERLAATEQGKLLLQQLEAQKETTQIQNEQQDLVSKDTEINESLQNEPKEAINDLTENQLSFKDEQQEEIKLIPENNQVLEEAPKNLAKMLKKSQENQGEVFEVIWENHGEVQDKTNEVVEKMEVLPENTFNIETQGKESLDQQPEMQSTTALKQQEPIVLKTSPLNIMDQDRLNRNLKRQEHHESVQRERKERRQKIWGMYTNQ